MFQKLQFDQLTCHTQIDYSEVEVSGRILPFLVELDLNLSKLAPGPGEKQKFCYRITGVGENKPKFANLSHSVFSICKDITADQIVNIQVFIDGEEQTVNFGKGGNVELRPPDKPDPPTGCPGLKFGFGLNKVAGAPGSTMLLCFELTTPYPVSDIDVCLSGAGKTARGLTICGPACEGPPLPHLSLTKECPTPDNTHFQVGDAVTMTLTVTNSGDTAVNGVTVVDMINVPANVAISGLTTDPAATTINPPTGPYSSTDIFISWGNLTVPAQASIMLEVTFTILAAPPEGALITNVDAGIGQFSGTDLFTCTIPVIGPPPPERGLNMQSFGILA
jgi:uncharacterized repeat protein (TIGR01451 family)